jgi:DeoR family transcriptional regulator of aga operon
MMICDLSYSTSEILIMPDLQFVEERRNAILVQIEEIGRVSVNTLSDEMHVSTVTIRQDLRALEQAGLLKRTYGGAIRRSATQNIPELSFHIRQGQNTAAKELIGAAAAALVHSGDSIALDASSTAAAMIPYLKLLDELTVVTNSLYIAQNFLDSAHVHILMPGGRLRRDAISLVGRPELLPNINLNLGFFGAVGIAEATGVTDVDPGEVMIKQAMIQRCAACVVLVDASKWGRLAPYTVLDSAAIRHIITTADAPADTVAAFRKMGAQIDLLAIS